MKKTIKIEGMHCISCEMLLEKAFKDIKNIDLISVNHKKWILELDIKDKNDYKKVQEIIKENNFEIVEHENNNKWLNIEKLLINIASFLGLWVFIYLFSLLDIYKYIPDTSDLSFLWAILIWLVASLSTCLAITWAIIIWFSRYCDDTKWLYGHTKVQIFFQLWRIVWFFILGWILWLIWKTFSISMWVTWILSFIVWILILYMWLNIVWLAPSITKLWVHMPKKFSSKIHALSHPKYAPLVWALTFFLPCWFTQTVQLIAISSGSFISWGLIMAAFALWTMPVLFSVWLWSSYFKEKNFDVLNKLIWALLIFFWIATISSSKNLISFTPITETKVKTEVSIVEKKEVKKEIINKKIETITMWHNWWQTEPKVIEIESWVDYKLVITPDENGKWCMSTLVMPKINKQVHPVRKWVDITYELKNLKKWEYPIVCSSMWMLQGKIIVK